MKIAFIGNHEATNSTETYHRLTFEKLGHTVIQLQENKVRIKDIIDHTFDMLYWTHTHGWFRQNPANEVIDMLGQLKADGVPTVGYHLDLWMGIHRERDLVTDPYWNIEHFFTVDKLMADHLTKNTKTKGHFLPAGVFEDYCYTGKANPEKYPHDIIFTGSKSYHPEWQYRPKLIEWLQKTYGSRFGHYGGGGLPTIRGHELNNLYASAKIVIGDTLCKNFEYPWYSSDRLFECAGRGAFTIYPKIYGLETFYEPYDEIIFYEFNNFDDLKDKIDYYLDKEFERKRVVQRAVERTKNDHTYTSRLIELLSVIQNSK